MMAITHTATSLDDQNALVITMTDAFSGGEGLTVNNAGGGDGIAVDTTGTGNALNVMDGGTSVLVANGAGAVSITPTSGQAATITTLGAGIVDITAAAAIEIDSTAAGISLDAAAASNVTTSGGDLTLSATGAGGAVSISSTFAGVSVSGTGNVSNTSSSSAVVLDAATDVDVTADLAFVVKTDESDANTGTVILDSTKLLFGHGDGTTPAEEGDAYITLNAQWTSATDTTGGMISIEGQNSGTTTIATGGVESSTTNGGVNPLIYVTDASAFSANEFLLLTGMAEEANNGLFEIISINTAATPDEITLRGVGSGSDTVMDFTSRELLTDSTVQGTVTNVDVCMMRCAAGVWQIAYDNANDVTWNGISTASTLNGVYINGNTATVTDTDGSFTLSNTSTTITTTDMFTVTNSPSVATTGDAVVITHAPGASSSGNSLSVTTGSNVTGSAFTVTNNGTGNSMLIADAAGDLFRINGSGAVSSTPASGQDHSISVVGSGGDISGTSGAGDVTFTGFTGSTYEADGSVAGSITTNVTATNSDGTAASAATLNLSAVQDSAAATATVSTVTLQATNDGTAAAASSTVNILATESGAGSNATTADINIRATGSSSGVVNTVNIQDTAPGTVNIATAAGDNTVNIASTGTGPADVNIGNTGSTAVLTLTSGTTEAEATSDGWVVTFPTKNVASTTNLDADAATNAGVIVNEATYTSFENGSGNGELVINRNTGYTSTTGIATFEVTVVSCSTSVVDTITAFTNNGAATDPTATLTTGGNFTAGDYALVTGGNNRENHGIYEVVSDATGTLTLEATPSTGAEFVKQQVTTTTGDSASVCKVTLSIMRVNASGQWEISENASSVATTVYQDLGSAAGTLATVVANTGSSTATMDADFTWVYGTSTANDLLQFDTH
jgi:hypothetical protein